MCDLPFPVVFDTVIAKVDDLLQDARVKEQVALAFLANLQDQKVKTSV